MSYAGEKYEVKVWDAPLRLFHWALAFLVAILWGSGQLGKLDIHMQLGVWVIALLLFRLAWGFAGSPTARFCQFVKGPKAILGYLAAARAGTARSIGHNPLGALSVLALLGILAAQSASGLFASDDIVTDGPLVHLVSSKTVSLLSTLHRIGGKVLLGLVAVHLAAVVFYKVVKKDDLVRAMITGTKRVPTGVAGITFANSWLAAVLFAAACGLAWGGLTALK